MPRSALFTWLLFSSVTAGQKALPAPLGGARLAPRSGASHASEDAHHVPYPASLALLDVLAGSDTPPRAGTGLEPGPLPVLYGADAVRLLELGTGTFFSNLERVRALREMLWLLQRPRTDGDAQRATVRLLIGRFERILAELDAVALHTRVEGFAFLSGAAHAVELRPAPPARGFVRLELADLSAAGLGLRGFDLTDPRQALAAEDATLVALEILDGLYRRMHERWFELRRLVPHGLGAVEAILLEMRALAEEAMDGSLVTHERAVLDEQFQYQIGALYQTFAATSHQGLALLEGGTVRLDCADGSSLGLRLRDETILGDASIDWLPGAFRALLEIDVELDSVRTERMRVEVARARIADGAPGHAQR